jgi:hypothetical protein
MSLHLKALSRTLILLLLCSMFAWLAPANSGTSVFADPPATELVLGDFESADETWDFLIGSSGSLGNGEFTRDSANAQTGSSSGKLQLNFSSSSSYRYSYVMLEKYLFKRVLPVDANELSFWVKTGDMARFDLILLDNSNQNHQQTINLQATDDWQKVTVSSFTSGTNYTKWGGKNDGIWYGPLKKMSFKLTSQSMRSGKSTGSIWFDDIRADVSSPELALAQVQVGNVFAGSQTAAFDVLTTGDTLAWSVYNAWGEPVVAGSAAVTGGKHRLNVTVLEDGYYRLSLAASSSGSVIKNIETTFAVLPAFDLTSVTASPFGIQTHFGINWNREMAPLLKYAGLKNVRDSFYWSEVELNQNQYTFNPKTTLPLQSFRDFSIDPLLVFGLSNKYYDAGKTPYTAAAHTAYGNYVKAMLNKFGSQLKWGEIWNEFNLPYFGGNGPAASRSDVYYELLKEGYEASKSVRPDLTVVGGVTADVPLDWLEDLFELGGLDYMDALSVHPYRYPQTPEGLLEEIAQLNQLVSDYNNGQTIPLWFSEIGWPTHLNPTGVDENTQAAYLIRSYVLSIAAGVEKIYWYNLMDSGTDKLYNEHNFGIVHNTGDALGAYTPKPAYVAMSTLTRQLTGAAPVSQNEADGIYHYTFHKNNEDIHVLWSLTQQNVTLSAQAPLTVTDMMGRTNSYTPIDGEVYLTLTGEPLFIQGAVTDVAEGGPFLLLSNPVFAGDTVTVTLQAGSLPPQHEFTAVIGFQGATEELDIAGPGDYSVQLPGIDTVGQWHATAVVSANGTAAGSMLATVEVKQAEGGSAKHVLRDGEDVIEVLIQNERETARSVTHIDWSIGASSGTETYDDATIAANAELAVHFPLVGLPLGTLLPYSFDIYLEDGAVLKTDGTVKVVAAEARVPLPYRTLEELEDVDGLDGIDLIDDVYSRIASSSGPEDFSGNIWAAYDDDHLYVYARVHDNVFSQPNQGDAIWAGDSIQFAVSAGMPGEHLQWYEYGMALTAQGPELYRWMATQGHEAGTIENPDLQITRDETAKDTIYQLALPWTELTPIATSDGLLSLSIVVNENDGNGRRGYVEWGSGIGSSKQSSLFKAVQLAEAECSS